MSQDYSIHYSPSMSTNEDIRGGCYTESIPELLQQGPLDFSWLPAMSQGYTMNYSGNTLTSGNVHRGYDPASMPELLQHDSLDCFGLPSMSEDHSIDYSGSMLNNENNHRQHETLFRPDPLQQGSLHYSSWELPTKSSLNFMLGQSTADLEDELYSTLRACGQQGDLPNLQGNMISGEYHSSTAFGVPGMSQGQVFNPPQQNPFPSYTTSYSSMPRMNSLDRHQSVGSSIYKSSTSTPFDKTRNLSQHFQRYNEHNISRVIMIPQPRYVTPRNTNVLHDYQPLILNEPIYFSVNNVIGFPMQDALAGTFAALDGRDDPMFLNSGPSVSLRYEWPGYDPWSVQIKTKDWKKVPKPITRAKVAAEIAKQLNNFLRIAEQEKIKTRHAVWTVGRGFIDIDRLLLVRLDYVSKGSCQPYFSLLC